MTTSLSRVRAPALQPTPPALTSFDHSQPDASKTPPQQVLHASCEPSSAISTRIRVTVLRVVNWPSVKSRSVGCEANNCYARCGSASRCRRSSAAEMPSIAGRATQAWRRETLSKEASKDCGLKAQRAAEGSLAGHPFCSLCVSAGNRGAGAVACPSELLRLPLRAGLRLLERNSTGDVVYVLRSGVVKGTMPGPEGRDCIVRLASRNRVVGLCAFLGVPHRHSAYVLHPGVACRIPVARLQRLRATDPTVIERLQRDWQQAVDDADRILSDLGQGSARARLARALLYRTCARPQARTSRCTCVAANSPSCWPSCRSAWRVCLANSGAED